MSSTFRNGLIAFGVTGLVALGLAVAVLVANRPQQASRPAVGRPNIAPNPLSHAIVNETNPTPTDAWEAIRRHPWWKPRPSAGQIGAILDEVCSHGGGGVFFNPSAQFCYVPPVDFPTRRGRPQNIIDFAGIFLPASVLPSVKALGDPIRVIVLDIAGSRYDREGAIVLLQDSLEEYDSAAVQREADGQKDLFKDANREIKSRPPLPPNNNRRPPG